MHTGAGKPTYKYLPKLWAAITYLLLVLGALFLFMGRTVKTIKLDGLRSTFHDFYFHVSNFSISMLIYLTLGYVWLLIGLRIRAVILAGIVIILINFIYELFIPLLNTPDIVDAYYGLAGVVLSFLFLFFTYRYGLTPRIPNAPAATDGTAM
jgi:hypothetical protein